LPCPLASEPEMTLSWCHPKHLPLRPDQSSQQNNTWVGH
jgi:hypothetical protein